MNDLKQPVAVIVGADEEVSRQIRFDLSRRRLPVRYEFPGARQALERLPLNETERTFFFFEIPSAADLGELERFSNAFPGCAIAAILTGPHGEKTVVDAMRAGAAQVVPYPVDREDLVAAI